MARLFNPDGSQVLDGEDTISQYRGDTTADTYTPNAIFSPVEAEAIDPSRASVAQKGLIRGGLNIKSGYADFGQLLTEAAGAKDATEALDKYSQEAIRAGQRFQPRVKSLAEAETAEDYFDFLVGGTAESIPFLGTTLIGGGVGGAIAKVAGRSAKAGAATGAFASVAAPETGFTYREIEHETGEKRPGLALAAGAAKGLLDTYALGKNLRTFLPKKFRTDAGKSALRDISETALREGTTEALQELVDIGAVRSAKDAELLGAASPEELQRILDVSVLGAAGGAAFGGAGRATVELAKVMQEKFTPAETWADLPLPERIEKILAAIPESQREPFAKSENFDSFEAFAEFMRENGAEGAVAETSMDVGDFGTLDDVAQAKVDEIFIKGADGVPTPSLELWDITDPGGRKKFTDNLLNAMDDLHRKRKESRALFNKALADGYTTEEAKVMMEQESPYEIENAFELAQKRAEKYGISNDQASQEIVEAIVARYPAMRKVLDKVGARQLLLNSRYIAHRTTEAAPFPDLEISTEELQDRGEHTIFREAGWDTLNKRPKVAKNQIPITLNTETIKDKKIVRGKKVVGLDFQSLINSAFRKGQGIRMKATHSIERVADAMQAGLSSLYSEETIDGVALSETLNTLTQKQKEALTAYTTAEGIRYSYADLEAALKTTKEKQTFLEKKEAELASLRKIDVEITRLSKIKDKTEADHEAVRKLMEDNLFLDVQIAQLEEQVALLRLEAKTRDYGTKLPPDVEEVKDPEDIETVPLKPLYGGKDQLEAFISEERYEERQTQSEKAADVAEAGRQAADEYRPAETAPAKPKEKTASEKRTEQRDQERDIELEQDYKSSGYIPEEDSGYEEGEINNTDWVADARFQRILVQAEKIVGAVGLGGKVTILTPEALLKLKPGYAEEMSSGALNGMAIPAESLRAKLQETARQSGLTIEQVFTFFKEDTGVDLEGADYFIYVNPKLSQAKATEVMSHEIGHAVLFDGITKGAITENIFDEYNKWLDYIREEDPLVREIFKDRTHFAIASIKSSLLNMKVSDYIEDPKGAERVNYMLDFHEWFADRVRNRLLDPKPPRGAFEKALEAIVNKLRAIFKLGLVVENTVEDYTEALMKGSKTNAWNTDATPHEVLQQWRDNIQAHRNATMSVAEQDRMRESDFKLIYDFVKRTTGHRLSTKDIKFIEELMLVHKHDALGAAFNRSFRYGFKVLLTDGSNGTVNEREIVSNAMNTAYVKRQVAELLRNSPEAWKDAQSSPDAMMAYAYQFWITGQVKLGSKTQGIMQKLFDFFKDLLGIITEAENAEMLLNEFTTGNAYLRSQNVAGAQFHVKEAARDTVIQRAVHDALVPAWKKLSKSRMGEALFSTANNRMFQTRNQWLIKIASLVSARIGTQFEETDMLTQRTKSISRFTNEIYRIFKGEDAEFGQAVIEILNSGREFTPAERNTKSAAFHALTDEEQAAIRTKLVLAEIHRYMKDAGMDIGFHENYFPWVFDEQAVGQRYDEFVALLESPEFAEDMETNQLTAEGVASAIMQSRGYADLDIAPSIEGHTPGFTAVHKRSLQFIEDKGTPEQRALLGTFFSKNIGHTMTTYIEQSVKRTEYNRRFGDGKLEKMLDNAAQHGATPEQLELAETYMNAIMGTHGQDTAKKLAEFLGMDPPQPGEIIDHRLQRVMGIAMVYQNIRVLSMATLTSLVDPIGIAVRTGDVGIAFQSLRLGLKAAFGKAEGNNAVLLDMAEMLGVIDRHMTLEALNWEYGGVYITGMERKINEGFFKMIGLQAWTRATRIMGLEGGLRFFARHVNHPNQHSERLLAELNLRPEDILLDENGKTKVLTARERRQSTPDEIARDDKVRAALHRFVDGAILRPNAALRPIWASDPHYMLIFHLKSFTYSFHEQIVKRVILEAGNGHLTPLLMFGLFIPFMIASDELRDLIKFGGDGDPQKAQWDVMDYVGSGMQRSGMLGLGQFAVDAGYDVNYGGLGYESFSGPTAQQLEDVFIEDNYDWAKAIPGQNLLKHYWSME